MAKKLQLRGGTTSQHSSFTGAVREVTVDTDKDVLVVHDGSTAGGFPQNGMGVVSSLTVSGTVETSTSAENITGTSDVVTPTVAGVKEMVDTHAGDLLASNNLSDIGTAATAFTNIKQVASATATGVVELATDAETSTGSDATRATTPAGVASIVGSVLQAYDADTLKADTADVLTAGFANTIHDAGTNSSGTYTPDEANGNMQKFINGGAHTLAPPANDCTLVLQQTNDASAGTITTSGFTLVDGDDFTTTNGHDFFLYITNSDAFSLLTVKALQ